MKSHLMSHIIGKCMVLMCLLVCATPPLRAQNEHISGTVVDASGLPVIGAGVVVDGTTNGVITTIDGTFTMDVPSGATLVVSCMGYETQRISVTAGQTVYNITLADDSTLLEEAVGRGGHLG